MNIAAYSSGGEKTIHKIVCIDLLITNQFKFYGFFHLK